MTERFALYAIPGLGASPSGEALRARAEAWLGRAVDGGPVTAAAVRGWDRAGIDSITTEPRRYGFHATLKAPFRLADGADAAQLEREVAALATRTAPRTLAQPALTRMGGFFALVPGAAASALSSLAGSAVVELDHLRAPATSAELSRRRPETLSPRRRELLAKYGYPYVLDEFRLHLTLTDSIDDELAEPVRAALEQWFAPVLGVDVPLDTLAIVHEPAPGAPFVLRSTHPLEGSS